MSDDAAGEGIDQAIGAALKELRIERGLSARHLSAQSDISAAMISRIENGLVSPSISTLCALAKALAVPLANLFRDARTLHTDFTFVRAGEGLKSTRISDDHVHEYVNLAIHMRGDMQFQARRVTLQREGGHPPTYVGNGVVFIQALEGEAVYRYGQQTFTMRSGDSISVDSELNHGFVEVLTPEFVFLTVQAETR
ncbi:helix-turn-helix domain-containing protein [Cochlodiniinecator piscidefendens]|uniref:helix-turn-helix domain-containing protein n=1 Tax=Cochlodiniinecator piscidefendens TaxID=2715756 RepID=UPI00140B0F71|nr:helix-turn-helix transcriptional regulator [Cochlodiniinecator piscidefendens]